MTCTPPRGDNRFVNHATDSRGVTVSLTASPGRIVSLCPSLTESLYDFGLAERVVGRTSYCPKPKQGSAPAVVGGTKNPDLARIAELKPDLVLVSQEENRKEDAAELEKLAPVFVTYPQRVADVPPMLEAVARVTGAPEPARVCAEIRRRAAALEAAHPPRRRTLAFIWFDPWWSFNGDSYIHDILRLHGCDNVFASFPQRWFAPRTADIAASRPDLVLFPDEPFRFLDSHHEVFRRHFPNLADTPARFVDGSLLTWPGTRTLTALETLWRDLA